jgi:EmrB/QacA subfamily drug resistance transporter
LAQRDGQNARRRGVISDVAHPADSGAARRRVGLLAIGLGTLVGPLDSSVNIAFPRITQDFGIQIESIQWVVIFFVLTNTSLMLVFGKLGDLFGHKHIFRVGLVVCAVAFVGCAAAPTFEWLLFARVIQGVGTGLVMACSPALVTALYPENRRARALGVFTLIFGLGAVLGPSLGGFMVQAWGWPSVFWFRAPLALTAALLLFVLPSLPRKPAAAFDFPGAILLALALGSLLMSINHLQRADGAMAVTIGLAVVSVAAFIGFVIQESRFSDPIIRLNVFRDIDFTVLNLTNAVLNLVGFSVMLFVPYYLVQVSGYPTTTGGLILAVAPMGVVLAGPLGGRLIGRIPANRLAFIGVVTVVVALLGISTWRDPPALTAAVGVLFLHGFGLGLYQVSYMHIVTGTLSHADRGVAGSLALVTRSTGVVLGATILSTMYAHASTNGVGGDGFVTGFVLTFRYAGAGLFVFLLATLIRPRIWFRRNTS